MSSASSCEASDLEARHHDEKNSPAAPEAAGEIAHLLAALDRVTTTVPGSSVVVASARRGLVAFAAVVPELDDARHYSARTKLLLVSVVAGAGTLGPMGTSIILPAVSDVALLLNTTVTMVNVLVGIYLLSLGIFPMWWSNFSERHGRRTVYVVSFTWFLAFSVACAVAPSISLLIVLRLLAGAGALAVQACGAATVADLYVPEERGTALGVFYLGPLLGPFLLPIIGGAVAEAWGWRATMWVMVIFCGVNLVLIVMLLPETLRREDVARLKAVRRARKTAAPPSAAPPSAAPPSAAPPSAAPASSTPDSLSLRSIDSAADSFLSPTAYAIVPIEDLQDLELARTETIGLRTLRYLDSRPAIDALAPSLSRLSTSVSTSVSRRVLDLAIADSLAPEEPRTARTLAYDYLVRPMHAVVLLRYPPVALAVAYSAIGFTGVYFFNISITTQYSIAPYNFSSIIVGLMYIPNSVTYVLASIFGGKWNDVLLRRHARNHNGELRPEARISWNFVVAVLLYPPACLVFGWCLDKGTLWVFPLIGTALFGFSSMLVIGITLTYIVDVLPGKGATGVAINNLVRQIFAAAATFCTEPLINALGVGLLLSIYMAVLVVCAGLMWYLKRNGALMRERYDITDYFALL